MSRSLLIRIGIVAAIFVGGVVLRPFIEGNAGDLAVGDCFDLPSATETVVEKVQHQPCESNHGGEVIWVGNYPGSKSDPLPSEDEVFAFLSQECVPAFKAYTGSDIDTQSVLDIGWFQPTPEGWKDGDQEMTCYAFRVDSAPFKGSVKKG